MSKGPSLESLGLHPTLVAALRSSDAQSMPFLSRVLSRTAADFADVLIDSRAVNTKERHALLVLFALHSVLSSSSASSASSSAVSRLTALVVVGSKVSADHLMERLRPLALHCEVEPLLCATKRQQRPPDISQKRRVVVVATAAALRSFVEAPFLRTVAAVAVEDMAEYDERQLVSVLRSSTSNNNNNNNNNSSSNRNNNSSNMMSHKAQLMLMCDDSLARVSPALRGCLCRCNRRYYHFSPHVDLSPCEPDTVSGTAPPASNQMLYMLYHNEGEHEELLHRVLRMYRSRRVVLLTHHKEIKHMVQIIKGWNIYNGEEDFLGSILRTDTAERHESTMASFLHNNNSHNSHNNNNNSHNNNNNNNNNNKSNKSNKSNNSTSFGDCGNGPNRSAVVGASLLVVWDAFTAVDLLDVDVLIQYYPLQKSLTDREHAEFVQVLHTTANPDPSHPNNFPRPGTVILTFLAPSDFTLASFFMRQYGQCGHILNIAPGHPDFEKCLRDPSAVLRIKQKKQKEKDQQQQQQQEKQRQEKQQRQRQQQEEEEEEKQDEAEAHAQVSAPLPLPRSMRRQSSGNVSEQPRVASGDCRRPTQADKESEEVKRR